MDTIGQDRNSVLVLIFLGIGACGWMAGKTTTDTGSNSPPQQEIDTIFGIHKYCYAKDIQKQRQMQDRTRMFNFCTRERFTALSFRKRQTNTCQR
jgi:hypothetical protein